MKRPSNKNILLILSLFLIFMIIGTATAADDSLSNDNDEVLTVDNSTVSEDIVSTDTSEDTEELTEGDSDTGSFSELNQYIQDNKGYEKTIKLNKNYKYNEETDGNYLHGINLPGYITIDGRNHTIEKTTGNIFIIDNCDISLKNIIFKDSMGTCISITGENAKMENLIFNNISYRAISTVASALHFSLKDSTFKNVGQALNTGSSSYIVENLYIDTTTNDFAVMLGSSSDNIVKSQVEKLLKNVTINNAQKGGIYIHTDKVTIVNSSIINSISDSNDYGKILQVWSGSPNILNCTFKNNSQISTAQGLLYLKTYVHIDNCKFIDNYAPTYIAYIYSSKFGNITNSLFKNNAVSNPEKLTSVGNGINNTFEGNYKYVQTDFYNDEFTQFIQSHSDDDVIDLDKNYKVVYTINLNKSVEIVGNNHIIDANGNRAFNWNANINVIFKDMTIKNAGNSAIYGIGTGVLTLNNVTFINASSSGHGGAVYIQGSPIVCNNSKFINCTSGKRGAAIYQYGVNTKYSTIENTEFIHNVANDVSVVWLNGYANPLKNNIFKDNTANTLTVLRTRVLAEIISY